MSNPILELVTNRVCIYDISNKTSSPAGCCKIVSVTLLPSYFHFFYHFTRGVVPLRHVPPDSMATLINSLQNRVNSITFCNFEPKHWKIVLVHSDRMAILQSLLVWNCPTKVAPTPWSTGSRAPTFTNDWAGGAPRVEEQKPEKREYIQIKDILHKFLSKRFFKYKIHSFLRRADARRSANIVYRFDAYR